MDKFVEPAYLAGLLINAVLGFVLVRCFRHLSFIKLEIHDMFARKKAKKYGIRSYSGIVPIDHSDPYYIYEPGKENLEIYDEGTSFIIPEPDSEDGQWYVFSKEPSLGGFDELREKLVPIFQDKVIKNNISSEVTLSNLEACLNAARKTALSMEDTQIEKDLYGIRRIIVNREGEEELPWCRFLVYRTNLYTRKVMHVLFNMMFDENAVRAIGDISHVHLLYPFIIELKLSIGLISREEDGEKMVMKKGLYTPFEGKEPSEKWLLYTSESIGQEDLTAQTQQIEEDGKAKLDLKEAARRRISETVQVDKDSIFFHDVFFIKEQLCVSVRSSAEIEDYSLSEGEEKVELTVSSIMEFLKDNDETTADYCKYSLVMWLSRYCIVNALEED